MSPQPSSTWQTAESCRLSSRCSNVPARRPPAWHRSRAPSRGRRSPAPSLILPKCHFGRRTTDCAPWLSLLVRCLRPGRASPDHLGEMACWECIALAPPPRRVCQGGRGRPTRVVNHDRHFLVSTDRDSVTLWTACLAPTVGRVRARKRSINRITPTAGHRLRAG